MTNDTHALILEVLKTAQVVNELTLRVLKPYKLNEKHYNILKALQESNGQMLTVSELKQAMFDQRGDITRLCDKLEAMGLIKRRLDPENRRVIKVSLAAETGKLVTELEEKLAVVTHSKLEAAGLDITGQAEKLAKVRNLLK